jgi:hypothetical protein
MIERDEYKSLLEENQRLREMMHPEAGNSGLELMVDLSAQLKDLLEENQRLRASIITHGEMMHRKAENAGLTVLVDLSAQLLKTLEPRK